MLVQEKWLCGKLRLLSQSKQRQGPFEYAYSGGQTKRHEVGLTTRGVACQLSSQHSIFLAQPWSILAGASMAVWASCQFFYGSSQPTVSSNQAWPLPDVLPLAHVAVVFGKRIKRWIRKQARLWTGKKRAADIQPNCQWQLLSWEGNCTPRAQTIHAARHSSTNSLLRWRCYFRESNCRVAGTGDLQQPSKKKLPNFRKLPYFTSCVHPANFVQHPRLLQELGSVNTVHASSPHCVA